MFQEIKKLLVKEMGIDAASVTPDAKLIADLQLNSLELAEFILVCEEEFDILIDDSELRRLVTVNDVAAYVEKHKA